jgi:hypothetical protein
MNMRTLHIYAQEAWHDEAYIAGTREDLFMLRTAIERALSEGARSMQSFTCDGEGYTVQIVLTTQKQADAMPVPYTDEIAKAQKDSWQHGPWALLRANAEWRGERSESISHAGLAVTAPTDKENDG